MPSQDKEKHERLGTLGSGPYRRFLSPIEYSLIQIVFLSQDQVKTRLGIKDFLHGYELNLLSAA